MSVHFLQVVCERALDKRNPRKKPKRNNSNNTQSKNAASE